MTQPHAEATNTDPTLAVARSPEVTLITPGAALVAWSRRHPVLTDAGWVLLLALLTGADVAHQGRWSDLLWQGALWVPVIFRRVTPVAVFVVVGIVATAQWAWDVPLGGDLAVLVVLYTIAAHRSRILAAAAAAAVEVGVVLAVVRFGADLWPKFLLLLTILAIATLCLGVAQQARRAHLAALTDRAERVEREAQQQAQLAAAAERGRIAREMHDIVAHSLSVMITLADGATLTDQPDQARTAMAHVARTGRQALADTRRVLDVLRTDTDTAEREPPPGLRSLETLLTTVRATGLHTSLSVSGSVFTVPDAAELAIYRTVQEALTNTLKHAHQPQHATVRLGYDSPHVTVEITDDGTAPDNPRPANPPNNAHGLLGIRERAALFDGRFTAGETTSGGWRVTVTLQLPDTPGALPVAAPERQPSMSTQALR